MDWYNQTYQEYPVRDERGKIVDMATAFEVLLDLPQENITGALRSGITALLGGSTELYNWATCFYKARSEVVHRGKARTLLYKHPQAATEHIGLLWPAQRIFVWCVETMMGEKRGLHAEEIVDLFTPNEVYLKRLKRAGNFEKIKENGLLVEVGQLKPSYPVGKREDIVWLGKLLLRAYQEHYITNKAQSPKTLDLILSAEDTDRELGLKYNDFLKEFESIYFRYVSIWEGDMTKDKMKELKPVPTPSLEQMQLENAIYNFARFAGFALLLPA
jgi:hypothetical protein